MRILGVFLTSAFLLAGGMAFAQALPSSSVRQDCPPGEPDSVQISWNEPCEAGTWLLDTELGCRMWDWHPAPEDKAEWSGACRARSSRITVAGGSPRAKRASASVRRVGQA